MINKKKGFSCAFGHLFYQFYEINPRLAKIHFHTPFILTFITIVSQSDFLFFL
jgi:hypothetical protein